MMRQVFCWKRRGVVAGLAVGAALGLWAASAGATTYVQSVNRGPFPPMAPADGSYNGTLASMVSDPATLISAMPGVISDVSVTVWMTHLYVGDLTIKLVGPGATTAILLNRPGTSPAIQNADNGSGSGGADANLSNTVPITFDDAAPSTLTSDLVGSGLNSTQTVGVDSPDNYIPVASSSTASTPSLSVFNGLSLPGSSTWTLYVGDSVADTWNAGWTQWSLTVHTQDSTPPASAVPEAATPLTASLAVVAVLFWVTRRRGSLV